MGFSSIKQKTLSVAISLLAGIAGSFFGSDLANRLIIGLAVAAAALAKRKQHQAVANREPVTVEQLEQTL